MNEIQPWDQPGRPAKRFFRAALLLLAQGAVAWALIQMIGIVFAIEPEAWAHNESLVAIHEVAKLAIITISVFLVVRIADEYDITSLGLKRDHWAMLDFTAGIAITFVATGLLFLLLLGFGWIRIEGFAWQSRTAGTVFLNILGTFLVFAFVGWSEELLARGFHLQTIQRGLNKFWGVFLSSLIFAYMHRCNPGMTWGGLLFIFCVGLVMAYAYLQSGQLWLSMGLHAGWDFFVVVVFFGVPIGGLEFFHLMDVSVITSATATAIPFWGFLALAICLILIRSYVRAKDQRISVPVAK